MSQNTIMHHAPAFSDLSAARTVASLFGVLAGIGGITHGVGEVLQGNVAPDGILIDSWTQGPIATNMGGEPGMTIIPNMLATGILNIIMSAAVIIWAAAFVERKHGGRILILLSLAMLLLGGGFGPPLIGILAGVAGTRLGAPRSDRRWPRILAKLWPVTFIVAASAGTFLVIGSLILVFIFGVDNDELFLNSFYLTVLSLLLTVLLAPAYDAADTDRVAIA
ncbi:MAG: hypothetical protein RRC07_18220 [Anaerolineae bacterium]|nr:hypothetical protein [Anaerolineae bacterium]